MTTETLLVVDANVAVKWFVPEPFSDRAVRLLWGDQTMIAPHILPAEFGSVMRKKLKSGEVEADRAGQAISRVGDLVELRPIANLLAIAWETAVRYDRSFYDALYVALAVREDCRVVTADEKLVNGMGPVFRDRFLLLQDV